MSGAGLDQVRERLVEPDPDADLPADADAASVRPEILVPRFAGAEHDERGVEARKVGGQRRDQIEPLLIDHP